MSSVFTCQNATCGKDLGRDHVILLTTAHMRRFCTVECIAEGQQAHYDALRKQVYARPS